MPRDTQAILIRPWADTGDRGDPAAEGIDRAQGFDLRFARPGGLLPGRRTFNQLLRELSGLAHEVNTRGVLEWAASVDYAHPAFATGADGHLYVSVADSGPNRGGAVNPIADPSRSRWSRY